MVFGHLHPLPEDHESSVSGEQRSNCGISVAQMSGYLQKAAVPAIDLSRVQIVHLKCVTAFITTGKNLILACDRT